MSKVFNKVFVSFQQIERKNAQDDKVSPFASCFSNQFNQ